MTVHTGPETVHPTPAMITEATAVIVSEVDDFSARPSYWRHLAERVLAAALSTCTVRRQWRYVWSDGGRSVWFETEPKPLGMRYVQRDGTEVTSVAIERRLVIETPPEAVDD